MTHWQPGERAAVLARSFDAKALGSLRLVTLEDGPTRGQRLLQSRTGQGLEADIAVDRGFDIAGLRYRGVNLGWLGPTDYPAPIAAETEQGLGLLRSFEGFLVTCGLDHHGVPALGPADHFNYPNRKQVVYPLHGRISSIPAVLEHRAIDLDAAEPVLTCTGVVRQAAVFGEVLELRRTIRMPLLGRTLHITDQVTNKGSTPARHGIFYHLNIGYPLLDETTVIAGLDSRTIDGWAQNPPRPDPAAVETFELVRATAPRTAGICVTNPARDGLSLTIRYDDAVLPALGVWQTNQSGLFALGIEPHTELGAPEEPYRPGRRDFLMPGEARHYAIDVELSSD